jgi:type I site-specific restriction-modification system R (restriction) subunit
VVLIELKNPADQNADVWKVYDQIQTYKKQIPDVFRYNELLVISDGTPEFDTSSQLRKVVFNEINNLAAVFAFSCGGTF